MFQRMRHLLAGRWELLLLLLASCSNALDAPKATHAGLPEVVIHIPHGQSLAISCRGPALRARLLSHGARPPLQTPMLDPATMPGECKEVQGSGSERGVALDSAVGASLTADIHGVLRLRAAGGDLITMSKPVTSKEELTFFQTSRLFGGGSSSKDANDLTSSDVHAIVGNTAVYSPHYYSEDGYAALAVVERSEIESWDRYPANYSLTKGAKGHSGQVTWSLGGDWDMYLMPAATLKEGTKALYALVGTAPVPPRYAFGFMASRWGWKDRAYVEDTLQRFRDGHFPIDAIIIDFEWFTNETDYTYPPNTGKSYYDDFGFNEVLFPEPRYQLSDYESRYHIKVAGIRKPRMGNSATIAEARKNGWLLEHCEPAGSYPPLSPGYACGRNLNYSRPEVRKWYADQLQPLLDAGMAFWWNDEGESDYFTFHYWNDAQREALQRWQLAERFFSVNRAFSPGMARLGATVWTGDVSADWETLRNTPGTMLKWILAGAPYVSCDSGGFNGESTPLLLVRWLQVAIFMPIMRTHSTIDSTPHFPWLWGARAAVALRQAFNLRYRLLPYHYSLAHAQYASGEPWIRPLLMDFPSDPEARDVSTQWMDGAILVAPILSNRSHYDIHLPKGLWYRLDHVILFMDQGASVLAGRRLGNDDELLTEVVSLAPLQGRTRGSAKWNEVPTFVRPGTVLTLSPVVQHSGDIGKHPLEVVVFGGEDGSFEMVEDDGWSTSYTRGVYRRTLFTWDDGQKLLSWEMDGKTKAPGAQGFSEVTVIFVDVDGNVRKAPAQFLGQRGHVLFTQEQVYQ